MMSSKQTANGSPEQVAVGAGKTPIAGDLVVPALARAVIVFAHGSGSSRLSPRNRFVAGLLNRAHYATLLADLLTPEEEAADARTGSMRFDIELLAQRLSEVTEWITSAKLCRGLPKAYFGASTGVAAAIVAAAKHPDRVFAIVSRGGRPDLAGVALGALKAPTLLIVGGHDEIVLDLNRQAARAMPGEVRLEIVSHATHLFEEPGALENVARLAERWFSDHLSQKIGEVNRKEPP